MADENTNNIPEENEELIQTSQVTRVSESSEESINKLKEVTSGPKTDEEKDIARNKEIAAASYVWLLSIPIFLFRKDSPFIQKHALQGLVLFGFSIVAFFIASLPYIGWIGFIMLLLYIILAVKGFLHAIVGDYYHAPVVTDFIENKLRQIHEEEPITSVETPEEVKEVVNNQIAEEHQAMDDISNKVHDVLEDQNNTIEENNDISSSHM